MTCSACSYSADRGGWPPGQQGTHCPRCHRTWTGKQQTHCRACCLHFGGVAAFVRHRVGEVCASHSAMAGRGLTVRRHGHGEVWVTSGSLSPVESEGALLEIGCAPEAVAV